MRAIVLAAALSSWAAAAAPLPPKPDRYVTDRTGRLDAARLSLLNETLAGFERDTSTQVVLYVAARIPAGATLEEVAAQALAEWSIGQKGRDNGVLFLAFLDDRVMRIEVGYGLEGALPDARAHQIITEAVTPRFRQGDFTGGIETAAAHIMAAARGEPFPATDRTAAEAGAPMWAFAVMFGLLGLVLVIVLFALVRGAWRRPAGFSHPVARRAGRAAVLLWAAVLPVAPFAAWKRSPALGYVALLLTVSAIVAGGVASALEKRKGARVRSIVGRLAFVVAACALPALLLGLATGGQDVALPLFVVGGALFVAMIASVDRLGSTGGGGYSYSSSGSGWSSSSSSSSDSSSSSFSGGGGESGGGGASGSW